MKKLITIIFVLLASCATVPKTQPTPVCPKPHEELPITKVTIAGDGKTEELVLNKEEFLSLYRLAEHYVALRESVKGATVEKNISIKKAGEDTYYVTIKLDDQMSVTALVRINNQELYNLREKMHRITTDEPKAEVTRMSKSKFKVTLTVADDIKLTTILDIEQTRGFDVQSFLMGTGAGIVLAAILKSLATKGALVVLFGL